MNSFIWQNGAHIVSLGNRVVSLRRGRRGKPWCGSSETVTAVRRSAARRNLISCAVRRRGAGAAGRGDAAVKRLGVESGLPRGTCQVEGDGMLPLGPLVLPRAHGRSNAHGGAPCRCRERLRPESFEFRLASAAPPVARAIAPDVPDVGVAELRRVRGRKGRFPRPHESSLKVWHPGFPDELFVRDLASAPLRHIWQRHVGVHGLRLKVSGAVRTAIVVVRSEACAFESARDSSVLPQP